jgi:ABC-type lipoprotein release transport system permease subunit
MFELSVASKYLKPRWRQISVSIISLISIFVIALVVWLVVVFFSVTHGLERSWIQKLTALTAPIRILPTKDYYNSYYYHVDQLSSASGYAPKTIREKQLTSISDPYNPNVDQDIPSSWIPADRAENGSLKDIVKRAFDASQSLQNFKGLSINDFEMTVSNLRLHLQRHNPNSPIADSQTNDRFLSQTTYLGTFDPDNTLLVKTVLPLSAADLKNLTVPPSKSSSKLILNSDPILGDAILLPKGFRDAGVLAGDKGHLSYYAPTTSSVQEQSLPIFVAGFYDPGIFPIGGKYVLANREIISTIRPESFHDDAFVTNGINVRFENLEETDQVKAALQKAFENEGISRYWRIETYKEFEFTKDLIQQLHSERNLWTLIATVIIIVACSNIISMLVILVNDKKTEIGILRSMGATSFSIAAIFGTCGIIMGAIGSIIGTTLAVVTLHNLQSLVDFIGRMQGYDVFNPIFYGDTLPSEVSPEALFFVILTTSFVSLLAGIVPAIKACTLRPSSILRSE